MRRRTLILLVVALLVLAGAGYFFFIGFGPEKPRVFAVTVVKEYPHDPAAFTEGLFFRDGLLYESTGEVGGSGVRKTRLETGDTIVDQTLPPPYFGEGIVDWKDRLYQVTWKDQAGFVYNLGDLAQRGHFSYSGEGWGLTHSDKAIILSDGTPTLRLLDPETLKQIGTINVTAGGCPVQQLNELEWVDGEIYANIWQTNLIARIDPVTGKVKSFLDVSALGPHSADPDAVPNGIAYDAAGKRLFVTGKLWPQLYEVHVGAEQPVSEAAATLTSCTK